MGTQLTLAQRGKSPQLTAHICCGQMDGWATWQGGRPRPKWHRVRWGPSSPSQKRGYSPLPQYLVNVYCLLWPNGLMDQDDTWHIGRSQPRPHCVRWGPSSPLQKGGTAPPIFGPCLLWPYGWMDQGITWYGGRPRPGHIVLDADPASPKKGPQPPIFGPCLL